MGILSQNRLHNHTIVDCPLICTVFRRHKRQLLTGLCCMSLPCCTVTYAIKVKNPQVPKSCFKLFPSMSLTNVIVWVNLSETLHLSKTCQSVEVSYSAPACLCSRAAHFSNLAWKWTLLPIWASCWGEPPSGPFKQFVLVAEFINLSLEVPWLLISETWFGGAL